MFCRLISSLFTCEVTGGFFCTFSKLLQQNIKSSIKMSYNYIRGKAVSLQAWTGPEGSRKLRFPDFVTTAQDGGRLSALGTGRLYPQEILLVLISGKG